MQIDSDIAIVGGGLNGPALALALSGAGFSVTLIDAGPAGARGQAGFDGRAYSLAAASQKLLTVLGVWEQVAESQPILDVVASQGRAGEGAAPFFLHFDHAELDDGPMGWMVEDRHLSAALSTVLGDTPAIRRISDTAVTDQEVGPAGVTLTLSTGTTITARLAVGCDGRRSGVAERAGIHRSGWSYDQTALVCAVTHDHPHQGAAHQFFMPGGPLAILPLPGGHRSSIVWSLPTREAEALKARDDAAFLEVLRPAFGDFLGEIALAGGRFSYPLSLSLADHYVRPRLALAGDAAHGVHPLAGQGLNIGLRDVAALAEVLAEAHRRGEDPGTLPVLRRYERWRRFDATALALGMDGMNRLFSNGNPLLSAMRGAGMGMVQALPPLRRAFMREAAGLGGETPRLLRGLPA
ncbi:MULTISPECIES: UbiH/UbiF/VisC/COQ6 family ubiquinone biosynthesis hydroxylase [Haematobacter]|uniref:2-octaprenyl-6-methoxyphenyl hydroxylase n=1 Tax=Haematobacter genomosp. 1 TaxID=366618 RepID=A0A212ACM9_9RHOB|nr:MULTISPECIES: UbiH/UbiF/VisC/COQ6 family ubiquinone biosynthesis hydroxylase [Haematobacter]OWJ78759.1 2-octaprenyl-6-methoxyphenyl hydroxylase [Haematobacter genomosp. 1]